MRFGTRTTYIAIMCVVTLLNQVCHHHHHQHRTIIYTILMISVEIPPENIILCRLPSRLLFAHPAAQRNSRHLISSQIIIR